MACDRARASAYRDGMLSMADARAFERHLAECADCCRTLALYQRIGSAVRSLPEVPPPPQLRRRILAKTVGRKTAGRPVWGAVALGFVGALAVVLLVVGAGRAWLSESQAVPAAVAPPSSSLEPLLPATPTDTAAGGSAQPTSPPLTATPTASPAPMVPSPSAPPPPTRTPSPPAESPRAAEGRAAPSTPPVIPSPPPPTPTAALPTTPPATATAVASPAASPTGRAIVSGVVTPGGSPTATAQPADAASRNVVRAPLVTPTPGCPPIESQLEQAAPPTVSLRGALGCPTGAAATVAGHEGAFENGVMLRRADTRRVFILAPERWATFVEGEEGRTTAALRPGEPAPPLLQAYRQNAAARDLLGGATAEPRAVQLTLQPFERGSVLLVDRRSVYVLYHDGRWELLSQR
ncbi:MAG: zf-HC2 domain-containing protein [Chloroflexota bacterium]|nr:zf-HC2 domain-containing protein [Chloroflexota bacterium]